LPHVPPSHSLRAAVSCVETAHPLLNILRLCGIKLIIACDAGPQARLRPVHTSRRAVATVGFNVLGVHLEIRFLVVPF
jgi:hypothetical protein